MENVTFNRRPLSPRKIASSIAICVVSGAASWFLQPSYHGNANAITVAATVFSVLAGFLIAVIAITADERSLRGRNWRQDVAYLELIRGDVRRQRNLFVLYLLVLLLVFVGSMDLPWPAFAQVWLERVLLFLAICALLVSFRIPGYLMRRHIARLEELIRERQQRENSAGTLGVPTPTGAHLTNAPDEGTP